MINSSFFACNKQIGRYKIIKEIGRGGSSSVFLCIDNHIGKKWAMKLILPEGENRKLCTSEIATLKSLDYYMFPRITDAFLAGDRIAIVTDYIEGENLESYLKREGPLSFARALNYFEELTKALRYLHNRDPGVLYLDMKPSNIMILPTGEIRVIDFGIASSIFSKGKCYGSPGYAAPEQYERGRTLSEKTDVYALGMTFLSMITGRISRDMEEIRDSGWVKKVRLEEGIFSAIIKRREIRNLVGRCTRYVEKDRIDVEGILKKIRRIKSKNHVMFQLASVITLVIILFVIVIYLMLDSYRLNEKEIYLRKMLDEASCYLSDGEYSLQGIRIICGYIDGNYLEVNTMERFSYEVAKFYFEELRDYSTARHYFSLISEETYPEVSYYTRLCRFMSEFNPDYEEINECTMKLIQITEDMPDGDRKNNNLELIGFIQSERDRLYIKKDTPDERN